MVGLFKECYTSHRLNLKLPNLHRYEWSMEHVDFRKVFRLKCLKILMSVSLQSSSSFRLDFSVHFHLLVGSQHNFFLSYSLNIFSSARPIIKPIDPQDSFFFLNSTFYFLSYSLSQWTIKMFATNFIIWEMLQQQPFHLWSISNFN